METVRRFPRKRCLLPCYDTKTGVKTNRAHFLPFKSNRRIKLHGFGIYGPMIEKDLDIQYGLLMDDFCNPGNHKTILSMNNKTIHFNGHRNVVQLMFHEPIIVRKYESYILFMRTDDYKTYRGMNGEQVVRKKSLKLIFSPDLDDVSETTVAEGNFPEIYVERNFHDAHATSAGGLNSDV